MTIYKQIIGGEKCSDLISSSWKGRSRLKHKIFFWLVVQNIINTRALLQRKGFNLDCFHYACCNIRTPETTLHLFWDCSFAHRCWITIIPFEMRGTSFYNETSLALQQLPKEFGLEIIILGLWHIWKLRNGLIFRQERLYVQEWRRNLAQDLRLLRHKIKLIHKDRFQQWMVENLD